MINKKDMEKLIKEKGIEEGAGLLIILAETVEEFAKKGMDVSKYNTFEDYQKEVFIGMEEFRKHVRAYGEKLEGEY